jgi:hypothetical protein
MSWFSWKKKPVEEESVIANLDLHPSLLECVKQNKMRPDHVSLSIPVNKNNTTTIPDRSQVVIADDKNKFTTWQVPSLRNLFRGTKTPPSISEMEHYPVEYVALFYIVESHILLAMDIIGNKTDQEFEEIYSNLRRRPDGRSLGVLHDLAWQAAAFMLGTHAVSEAEFDAVFRQLTKSARTFKMGPSSRNYVDYLRRTFSGEKLDDIFDAAISENPE